MEISPGGVRADISAQRELWSLVKARRQSQQDRRDGLVFVEQQLGGLLLGQNLSPAQQADYVRRLAGTAALAAEIGLGPELADLSRARVPRELLLWKAGGTSWRPFPVSKRAVQVTPLHRRLQDRMALALKNKLASDPQAARTCVQAVGVTVERGSFSASWGDEDRVELTGWGMEMLAMESKLKTAPMLPPPPVFLYATVGPASGAASALSNR